MSRSPAWEREEEIVHMYDKDGLSVREIGEAVGCSSETARTILLSAGVNVTRKGRLRKSTLRLDSDQVRTLYVDEGLSIVEISQMLNVARDTVSRALKDLNIPILIAGQRQILYPELRQLKIGESIELPRVHSPTDKRAYIRYYAMAAKAGIKVSVQTISDDKVRVTRKS